MKVFHASYVFTVRFSQLWLAHRYVAHPQVSPGQVVSLVVAQLLSTMCVVQGMMGTSLLQENKTTGSNAAGSRWFIQN